MNRLLVSASVLACAAQNFDTVRVSLVEPSTPFPHFWESCVGSGHAALVARSDWREHMKMGHDDLGIDYVRYHGVLGDDMMYYDAPGNNKRASYYNVLSDYSYLLSIGVRPLVELSFTPSPVNSGTCNHFYYKGCETVPTDFPLYTEYIQNFTQALVDHFGVEEVRQWYFEVYNEADLHWSFDDYYKLYRAAAIGVKAVDAGLRVGGPASAFPVWVEKLIAACANESVPLDFVTSHAYTTTGGARRAEMKGMLKQLNNAHTGDKPWLVTEWNGVCDSRASWHDETAQAAFVVAAMDAVSGLPDGPPDAFCLWALSDVFVEQGLPAESVAFHGGFGLISLYGVKKPGYQALALLRQAGAIRASVERSNTTNVTVLPLFDEQKGSLHVFLANDGYVGQDLHNVSVNLTIEVPEDKAVTAARLWRIDEEHTNPKSLWESWGAPNYLKPAQIAQLKTAAQPVPSQLTPNTDASEWSISLPIPAFGLAVIELSLKSSELSVAI